MRNGRGKGVLHRCHAFSELNILFSSFSYTGSFSYTVQVYSCLTNTIQCSYGQGHKEIHSLTTIKISWREILQSQLLQFIYGYFPMNEFHCESEH